MGERDDKRRRLPEVEGVQEIVEIYQFEAANTSIDMPRMTTGRSKRSMALMPGYDWRASVSKSR
jgi:hypothetical protein